MSPRREPLRAAPLEATPVDDDLEQQPPADAVRWLTVAEAAEAADVSVGTIRRWYSGDDPDVPSEMRDGTHGPERVMPADAVRERAARSGRRPADFDAALAGLDGQAADVAAPDTLPVPREDWERLLERLATADEIMARAAKAEAEATFLRERLGELRAAHAAAVDERDAMRAQELERLRSIEEAAARRRWWQRPTTR